MVDDVFFIARKVGMRCLVSNNVQCVAALLAQLNELLGATFKAALQVGRRPGLPACLPACLWRARARVSPWGGAAMASGRLTRRAPRPPARPPARQAQLQGGPARLLAAAPGAPGADAAAAAAAAAAGSSPSPAGPLGAEYAAALNNADVAADYVTKLKGELEGYLGELFTQVGGWWRVSGWWGLGLGPGLGPGLELGPGLGAAGPGPGGDGVRPASPAFSPLTRLPSLPPAPPPTTTQAGDRERAKSVLADLAKTSGDFRQLSTRALEALSDALLPRLRAPLDEVGGRRAWRRSRAELHSPGGVSGARRLAPGCCGWPGAAPQPSGLRLRLCLRLRATTPRPHSAPPRRRRRWAP
jgi:hypothetical protein